jgi:hypothetical protein
MALAEEFGIERLGFLTLTFPDELSDIREASRRFNSLATNVLKKRYLRVIRVWERHKSGVLHAHCVVVLHADIRTGFNFADLKTQRGSARYRTACPFLRAEWAFWRSITNYNGKRQDAPYPFGRTELLPVKSTAEGIAYYVGGYIGKHMRQREWADRGVRLVSYLGFKKAGRRINTRFSWVTPNARLLRMKIATFAWMLGCEHFAEIRGLLGPRWLHHWIDFIVDLQVPLHVQQRFGMPLPERDMCPENRFPNLFKRPFGCVPLRQPKPLEVVTVDRPWLKRENLPVHSIKPAAEASRAFVAACNATFPDGIEDMPEERWEVWQRLRRAVRLLPAVGMGERPLTRAEARDPAWWEW